MRDTTCDWLLKRPDAASSYPSRALNPPPPEEREGGRAERFHGYGVHESGAEWQFCSEVAGGEEGPCGWVCGWRGSGGWGSAVCHPVPLLPELAVQPCVARVYTRDGVIDNG